MTSNIKKMYILFIVVREIEGKKASFEIRALQVRRTAGNVKVPRCFTFHKCDLSKKKFNRPLLVMLTQLNSTQLDVKLKTDKVWEERVLPDETCWVLSLHFWHPDVYIYLYGGISCSVKLHPWSVLWPYFPLEYFYFRRVFYGEVIHV